MDHELRFTPAFQHARDALQSGAIGAVVAIDVAVYLVRFNSLRRQLAQGCNCMMNRWCLIDQHVVWCRHIDQDRGQRKCITCLVSDKRLTKARVPQLGFLKALSKGAVSVSLRKHGRVVSLDNMEKWCVEQ